MKFMIFYEQHGYGGVDTHLAHLLNHWPEPKDEIVVVSNPDNEGLEFFNARLKNRSVYIHTLEEVFLNSSRGSAKFIRIINSFRSQFRFIKAFRELLEKEAPNILLSNNGGYPGGVTNFLAVIIGKMMGKTTKKSTFLLIHHSPVVKLSGLFSWYTGLLARWVQHLNVPMITVSEASKKGLQRWTPLKNFQVIYNGLEIKGNGGKPFDFRSKLHIPPDKVVVGMIGPVDPHKGHATMQEVFRESIRLQERAHLVIVGSGSEELVGKLKKKVLVYGLEKLVTFTGFLPGDSISIIAGFDILVMPTVDFEGFGYSMAEAMSAGIPVVASRVGAIPEIIVDGESGFLLEPGNVSAWVRKLESLVEDGNKRKSIGASGSARIQSRFSAQEMSRNYFKLLTANETS